MMMCLIGILPGIASHHGILLHLVVTKNFSGKDMIFKVSFPELALRSGDRGGRRLEARGRYRTAGERLSSSASRAIRFDPRGTASAFMESNRRWILSR
jgi:hypothetical protein